MGATAAVAGQNLGAGFPERSVRAAFVASMIGIAFSAVVGLAFLTIPRILLSIFGMDEGVQYELGRQLLTYLAVSGLFVTVALGSGIEKVIDQNAELSISTVLFSPEIYIPIIAFFIILIIAFIIKKFYFKQ